MSRHTLTEAQIVAWALVHRERTGRWPTQASGAVIDAVGERWKNLEVALRLGRRGLPGGDSLSRLLARKAGARNRVALPALAEEQILAWADAHHARTGKWPTERSGPVPEAPGNTWAQVSACLRHGYRGLPGGSSLARLLADRRGARNNRVRPPLIVEQVVAWAEAHRARTGRWPRTQSGPVTEAAGESWNRIDFALRYGLRGLPGGSSLARLLAEHEKRP